MSPNAPRCLGVRGTFEIWFLCIFDPTVRRALWLRLTTRADARTNDDTVSCDGGPLGTRTVRLTRR